MAHTSTLTITIVDGTTPAKTVADRHVGVWDNPAQALTLLQSYLAGIQSGTLPAGGAKVHVFQDKGDGTAATMTIACTRANAAGDTVTVAGVVFTEATSPSSNPHDGQFARGASDTTCGDNLAAAINAHPRLKGLLTAAAVTGTVTLTCADKGIHGNLVVMATSDATAFALTQPTNGAKGTVQTQTRTYRRGM